MENLQPKLRFPEFEDNYYKKNLEIISKILSGKSKKDEIKKQFTLFGSTGIIGFSVEPDYSGERILVARVGANAGYLYKVNGIYGVSDNTLMISEVTENINFLFYLLKKENLNKYIFGSGQPLITGTILKKLEFNFPTLQEQTKIADFLGAVDKQLDILNQKKEKLNTYKKGVMQQLFSQQIRFKDDNGNDFPDWEEKRLLDFENLIHGDGDWILAKDIDSEGNINVIQLGNIGKGNFIDKDYKKITIETFNEIKGTPIKKGDLLINRMLNNYKLHSCLFPYNGDYITSVDVCWIRENIYFNNYFLKSLFSWEKSQEIFVSLSSGSGRIRISKKNLFERFVFKLPSIEEQTKIANFLSAIDTQIEAVENQITKTETYKKGLLQQMFV